jgi:hypothetical protein
VARLCAADAGRRQLAALEVEIVDPRQFCDAAFGLDVQRQHQTVDPEVVHAADEPFMAKKLISRGKKWRKNGEKMEKNCKKLRKNGKKLQKIAKK